MVPATGTTTIKYAYGQAEVEALVADATAQPTPDAPPPTPDPLPLPGNRVSTVTRRVTKPGIVFLTVSPTLELRSLLQGRGVVDVTVNVEFAADHGSKRGKSG